jgi:hypothetical protein
MPGVRSTQAAYLPEPIASDAGFIHTVGALAAMPASFERFYLIQGQLSPELLLTRPIPVRVFIEGEEFVADQTALGIHAFGRTVAEAVIELRDEIAEHFDRLVALGAHISPRLRRERDLLASVLVSVNAHD